MKGIKPERKQILQINKYYDTIVEEVKKSRMKYLIRMDRKK